MCLSSCAAPVTGVLDGVFESGYFVTVTIESENLKGVLYPLQSSPLNTVTHEKLNKDEKAVCNNNIHISNLERF